MIVQIVSHTPIWVYALFCVLLVFGLIQMRTRTVRKRPALLLPGGMIALSLAGIYSSFGLTTIPLTAYGVTPRTPSHAIIACLMPPTIG